MIMIAAASSTSLSLGHFHCHRCHAGFATSKPSFELQRASEYYSTLRRSEKPFFGTTQCHWWPLAHDVCISRVSVAADYSDSVPESSGYVTHNGYHPLEELRDHRRVRDTMLTSAEIARTAVEANDRALLIFPSIVHCEPHEQFTWAEYRYITDGFGDIFFEIYDAQNILRDQGASNPVTALIGMDISDYESRKMDLLDESILEVDSGDEFFFADDYIEVQDPELTYNRVDWGMPENSSLMHPVYFAKCLTKAVDVEYAKSMDHPSNGVSVWGHLSPTFIDEEYHLRQFFNDEDSDAYSSNFRDEDNWNFDSRENGSSARSTIYRLDITKIELFSVYGIQSVVGVQDFQYAEPDVLVHSTPSILEQFTDTGVRCNAALRALCKKKGLHVERANLIGVDSLGMDVRVSIGTEVRTHRFSFKSRATSGCAADKQIQQLLFPRSRRKKLRTLDRPTDRDSF